MGTSNKRRCKNVRGLADETAFPCDTDRCEWVITGDHSTGKVGGSQRKNRRRCPRFELILKDDQSKETKTAFSLFTEGKSEGAS